MRIWKASVPPPVDSIDIRNLIRPTDVRSCIAKDVKEGMSLVLGSVKYKVSEILTEEDKIKFHLQLVAYHTISAALTVDVNETVLVTHA